MNYYTFLSSVYIFFNENRMKRRAGGHINTTF